MEEDAEIWLRDPVECVRELLGNAAFEGHAVFRPERHFTPDDRSQRVYSEMWTGDWWWDTQVTLGQ